MNEQTQNSLKIYQTAKALLDQTESGNNPIDGCAETVNNIFIKALGVVVGGGYSTALMFVALHNACRFQPITLGNQLPGDIIISPTGSGNGVMPNGHVGIVGEFGILSNNSENGLLQEVWTVPNWQKVYGGIGGFPVLFFRVS